MKDPSSHVAAAVRGWTRPWSNEAFVLADLFDLTVRIHTKRGRRQQRYPRPSDGKPKQYGNTGRRSQADVRAALATRGHLAAA